MQSSAQTSISVSLVHLNLLWTLVCFMGCSVNALLRLHYSIAGTGCKIPFCLSHGMLMDAGMMCIISASREMGLDTSDLPLHIFGPSGLAEYLRCCLLRPFLQLMHHDTLHIARQSCLPSSNNWLMYDGCKEQLISDSIVT